MSSRARRRAIPEQPPSATPTLVNRCLTVDFDLATGGWTLSTRGEGPALRLASTAVVELISPLGEIERRDVASASFVRGGHLLRSCLDRGPRLDAWRSWPDGLRVEQHVELDPVDPVIIIGVTLDPPSGFSHGLRAIVPVAPPTKGQPNLTIAGWGPRFGLIDIGWTATEPARWLGLARDGAETDVVASGLVALGSADHLPTVTLGLLDPQQAIGEFRVCVAPEAAERSETALELAASASFGTVDLPPRGRSTCFFWLSLERLDLALSDYSRRIRARAATPVRPADSPRLAALQLGDADRPSARADEATFLGQLAACGADSTFVGALDAALIPLGWEKYLGDGVPDPARFPRGLRHVRDAIEGHRWHAGLTLAPFEVARWSSRFAAHPTWVDRTSTGDPLTADTSHGNLFALDATQPEVDAWLRALGEQVTGAWGFDLVRLNCLSAALGSGWRSNLAATPLDTLRRGIAALRAGLGDATVVAAGGPLFGLSDLVDVVETDARPLTRADPSPLLRAFVALAGASVAGGVLTLGSPGQTLDEARAAGSIAALGGGAVVAGDCHGVLPAELRDVLRVCLPSLDLPLLPRDPFAPGGPRVFATRVGSAADSWLLVIALNALDVPSAVVTSFGALGLAGRHHAFEFWSQSYLGILTERLTLQRVPPGGCAVVALRPEQPAPHVVGTSLHVTLGAVDLPEEEFSPASGRLRLVASFRGERRGTITLAVPRGWATGSIRGTGGSFGIEPISERLTRVSLHFRDVAEIEVQFWNEDL